MVDATQVQIRRGTEAQCEVFVPVEGEVICDLTNDTLRVGDGARPGGFIMPNGFHIQNQYFTYAEDTGTENALVADLPLAPLALTVGLGVKIRVAVTNTGASTLNLNGLGAVGIRKVQAGALLPLAAGDLSAGIAHDMTYDGTYFVLATAGGLPAPVAGTDYVIYRRTTPGVTRVTNSISYVSDFYQDNNANNFAMHVLLAGEITVRFEHRVSVSTGSGTVQARVLKNGVAVQTWNHTGGAFVTRTVNVTVDVGDVITVQHRFVAPSAIQGNTSHLRNLEILSGTAVGAVSG